MQRQGRFSGFNPAHPRLSRRNGSKGGWGRQPSRSGPESYSDMRREQALGRPAAESGIAPPRQSAGNASMCVRYTLHKTDAALAAIAQALARNLTPPAWAQPRYNVALTHVMPVVAIGGEGPEVRGMMWGYVPFYERGKTQLRMLPNAKAETATTSAAFRQAAARRRCLVPANGFYEWKAAGKVKRPHVFMLQNEEPFAFAGIWETAEGEKLPETFAILTTEPNGLVSPIHNRMPVILTTEVMGRWLGDQPLPEEEFRALTQPLGEGRMTVRPVNRFVSNSRNEGPQCLAPPEEEPPELPLGSL